MIPSYPHTRHWPASLTVHRDDHYHQNHGRFVGPRVIIEEKLDGGICGINRGAAHARSSGEPTRESWFDYVKSRTVPRLYGVDDEIVVWGEDLYAVHSIEYGPLPDSFFLFHVMERHPENIDQINTVGDYFWGWPEVEGFAQAWGLQTVPVLYDGVFRSVDEITDWFMAHISEPSAFGPNREGFVMRIREGFSFNDFEDSCCKFVRKNHVQTNEHWTKHWKPATFQGPSNAKR